MEYQPAQQVWLRRARLVVFNDMWGIFGKPKCPIDSEMQCWVDGRFRWLQDQFGIDAPCKQQVILPTPEFFPDDYSGTLEDVSALMTRVAGYMNVDPGRFDVYLFNRTEKRSMQGSGDVLAPGAAGLYHMQTISEPQAATTRASIGISETTLSDPMSVVATLAHEIGHEILLGQKRIEPQEADHEPLTDLLTVFLGLGIFTANSTVRDASWRSGQWSGWQVSRLGYLEQPTFGYALAQFARVRSERTPPWMRHVRPDVRAAMKQSLRFLSSE